VRGGNEDLVLMLNHQAKLMHRQGVVGLGDLIYNASQEIERLNKLLQDNEKGQEY
jgi:hypothetical protein